jgi:uncharacterized protein YndB with AHSA1/START domain
MKAEDPARSVVQGPAEPVRCLEIERVFDAPRELVFAAWTNTEALLRWMGPTDHPAVAFEQDLRVGGRWRGRLRPAGGGDDLCQGGVFLEIEPPARLVFTFAWESDNHEDGPGAPTVVSVDLSEEGPRTRMRFRQSGLKSEDSVVGHDKGWASTFDRLQVLLNA